MDSSHAISSAPFRVLVAILACGALALVYVGLAGSSSLVIAPQQTLNPGTTANLGTTVSSQGINCDSDIAHLARQVFRPTVSGRRWLDNDELDGILARLRPTGHPSLSLLVHAVHLFGAELSVAMPGKPAEVRVFDLMLSSKLGAEYFEGAVPIAATRYGARAPLHEPAYIGTSQLSAQAHPGQLVATLAQNGIPSTREIVLESKIGTVEDLLRDLAANFTLEGEIQWDAVALVMYLPQGSWRNKWNVEFRVDDLVAELSSRVPTESSCGGTHDLIALTVILRVDRFRSCLSPETRESLRDYLQSRVHSLVRRQAADGSWGTDWHLAVAAKAGSPLDSVDALLITGHHLEWLMLLPQDLAPPEQVFDGAARWLLQALEAQTRNDDAINRDYCPMIHAARSLKLLASMNNSSIDEFGSTE